MAEGSAALSGRIGIAGRRVAKAAAAAALFALAGCGLGPGGCGTEVPDNQEIAFYGCAEQADGGPAVSARVVARGRDINASASEAEGRKVEDVGFTDPDGRFEFGTDLAEGEYDLVFEDTASGNRKGPTSILRVTASRKSNKPRYVGRLTLAPTGTLMIRVQKAGTDSAMTEAFCSVAGWPEGPRRVGEAGLALFYLPAGTYDVACEQVVSGLRISGVVKGVTVLEGSETQYPLGLRDNAEDTNPLPPPQNFEVEYDDNSGIAMLTWSPVIDKRVTNYGVRRIDINRAGEPSLLPTLDTALSDPVFSPRDTVQFKTLVYSVYSQRDKEVYSAASRSVPLKRQYQRPLVYGPRIEELRLLPKPDGDSNYRAGDTVRIEASWANALRENASLYWKRAGVEGRLGNRFHPDALGRDTLAFALPAAGGFEIGFMIEDVGSYRSWTSKTFHFYGTQP